MLNEKEMEGLKFYLLFTMNHLIDMVHDKWTTVTVYSAFFTLTNI